MEMVPVGLIFRHKRYMRAISLSAMGYATKLDAQVAARKYANRRTNKNVKVFTLCREYETRFDAYSGVRRRWFVFIRTVDPRKS